MSSKIQSPLVTEEAISKTTKKKPKGKSKKSTGKSKKTKTQKKTETATDQTF